MGWLTTLAAVMPHETIEDPAPLTPQPDFPFAVIAFPVRNLVQMGVIPAVSHDPTPPAQRADDSQHFEP